jgi:hypothetical protein
MQPGYAMKIIQDLKKSKKKQSKGYTIGEWGISFEVDLKTKVSKSSEPGLLNPMHLSPDHSAELFTFLQSNLDIIREMSDEDQDRYDDAIKLITDMILQDMQNEALEESNKAKPENG